MKLYIYGIIDSNRPIQDVIGGLEGSSVYSIPYYDIGAVVSEISRYTRIVTESDVLEHEAVVEKLMADFTVLPMRFQSVVDNRDSVISIMRSYYNDFRYNLERLHHKLEFGIKVIWPADAIREDIVKTLGSDKQKTLELCASTNNRFMKERFERYRIDKIFHAEAEKLISVMDMTLGKLATEKKLQKLKTENLLLDAVYLIEESRQSSFREAFGRIKDAHLGLKFLLSGPWPAYNFVVLSKPLGPLRDCKQARFLDRVTGPEVLVGVDCI